MRSPATSPPRSTCARSPTSSSSPRTARCTATRAAGCSRRPTSASCRPTSSPQLPADTAWHPVDDLPPTAFDHHFFIEAAIDRLRAKLSYTNIGFALAPPQFTIAELRDIVSAALGYQVSSTNLTRVLTRRRHDRSRPRSARPPGNAGGRPAIVYRFATRELTVTDPFAVLKPSTAR